jgi:prevent-host-death family protein
MRTVTARVLQQQVKDCLDTAQEDRVVITRHGRPTAVLVGVEGKDWETVLTETDPKFWKLIRARRRQPTMSPREVRGSFKPRGR